MRPTGFSWLYRAVLATSLAPLPPAALRGKNASAPAPTSLTFDVVSVEEDRGPNYTFTGMMNQPDGLHAIADLKGLVAIASNMRREFVTCKLPLCDKPIFEIRGKLDSAADQQRFAKLSCKEQSALLLPILKDRFGLNSHVETRPTNVFDLVIAKGGPKLSPPPADHANSKQQRLDGGMWIFPHELRGFAVSIPDLVPGLSQFVADALGRPVVDKTGLTGTYDFDLKWTDSLHAGDSKEASADPSNAGPGIFAALPEQLGLELKPAREPEDILVVDEHTPPRRTNFSEEAGRTAATLTPCASTLSRCSC